MKDVLLCVRVCSERIESRTGTQTVNNKKDSSKDENKAKENDTKPKRSSGSSNGSKENSETPSKVNRYFSNEYRLHCHFKFIVIKNTRCLEYGCSVSGN